VKKAGVGSAALVSLPDFADALTTAAEARSPAKKRRTAWGLFCHPAARPYEPVVRIISRSIAARDVLDTDLGERRISRAGQVAAVHRPVEGAAVGRRLSRGAGWAHVKNVIRSAFVRLDLHFACPRVKLHH
jgi:hypothetical protein